MVDAPCSRVGHIYRKYSPFSGAGKGDYLGRNYKRVEALWWMLLAAEWVTSTGSTLHSLGLARATIWAGTTRGWRHYGGCSLQQSGSHLQEVLSILWGWQGRLSGQELQEGGGTMVDAPCSRVGHIYRKYSPFSGAGK